MTARRSRRGRATRWALATAALVGALCVAVPLGAAAPPTGTQDPELQDSASEDEGGFVPDLRTSAIRLPLAAALGTALALRPRRRGTPPRRTPVVQTQIVLAVVGAIVMLIVGVSLARAFGIVGVASLIRYRTKIDDPKDAVVMLSALAVGLSSGSGHYVLAVFGTLFLVGMLGVIESFEPRTRRFELSVKLGDETMALRPKIETALRKLKIRYELRGVSEDEVSYLVTAPAEMPIDKASKALTALGPEDKGAVEWSEIPNTKAT